MAQQPSEFTSVTALNAVKSQLFESVLGECAQAGQYGVSVSDAVGVLELVKQELLEGARALAAELEAKP